MSYRIQLICSNREEAGQLRSMIPDSLVFSSQLLPAAEIELEVEELVLERSWDVDFRHKRVDLGIISMDTGSTTGFMAQSGVMRDNVASVLFLSSSGNPPPNWTMRHRRDGILSRPVSDHSLRAAIEQVAIEAQRILPDQIAEHHLLAFITHLIERGSRLVQPMLSPNRPAGFAYPLFEAAFGKLVDPIALGEHLTSLGLVKKTIFERQRLCPVCGSPHLVYREGCPRCSSRDYGPFDGIHHISCGFTGDRRAFLRGSALICPQCNRTLEQEGRDFTRPNEGLRCGSCSYTFAQPDVVVHCQHCGNDGQPNETEEQLLPQYELLPQADEAALIRRIGVADIVSSIRSQHTGLFTRQYFEYELRRELIRFKRYNVPSSILMIRIANLAGLRAYDPVEGLDFATYVFRTIGSQLRTLDVPTIWTTDIFAVLLPATAETGADLLRSRINARLEQLDVPEGMPDPSFSIATVTLSVEFDDEQQVIASAISRLA